MQRNGDKSRGIEAKTDAQRQHRDLCLGDAFIAGSTERLEPDCVYPPGVGADRHSAQYLAYKSSHTACSAQQVDVQVASYQHNRA